MDACVADDELVGVVGVSDELAVPGDSATFRKSTSVALAAPWIWMISEGTLSSAGTASPSRTNAV